MIPSWLDRLLDAWHHPAALSFRQLIALAFRVLLRLAGWLFWRLRILWAGLGGQARAALTLAVLIVIASSSRSFAPSLSATAQGLAVLLVAGVGLWMIVWSPLRRRRW